MRKPVKDKNFSIENFYYELFKNFNNKKIKIKFKICPLESKNFFNRIYLCFWAFFNQGSINHICGDVNFISFFLSKKKTINTILDCYSMKRLKMMKRLLYLIFWLKIPLYKSKKIITISKKTSDEVIKYANLKNTKKIDVIGVCTLSDYKKSIKKKINKIPKILIVGTAENKNISNIILSLRNIKCELVIIGILKKNVIQEIQKNKINYKNYVSISTNKLINIYKQSDLLLYPSNYEGFGMPIIEAQSIGRAVITSKIEPMKSVAGDGAIFVNPRKISEISKAVKIIINSYRLRNSLIKKGFVNIKRFKKEVILKKHLKVYNDVMNSL